MKLSNVGTGYFNLTSSPSRLIKIKITSTNIAQLQYKLTVRKKDPFAVQGERYLYPGNNQDQYVNQTSIVTFNTNEVLDANTEIEYAAAPSSTSTVTMYFGASLNHGQKLQNAASTANRAIAASGGQKAAMMRMLQSGR